MSTRVSVNIRGPARSENPEKTRLVIQPVDKALSVVGHAYKNNSLASITTVLDPN